MKENDKKMKRKRIPGRKFWTALTAVLVSLGLIGSADVAARSRGEVYAEALAAERRLTDVKAGEAGKTEVVYVKLNSEGEPTTAYVVNRFEAAPGKTIDDFGNYSEVEQLSLNGSMSQGKDIVSLETGGKDFYYQGKLKECELPWTFELHYRLNGKEVSPHELGGASGDFELELAVAASEVKTEAGEDNPWAKKNMLQISITMPSESVTDLKAEGGSTAQAGSDSLVNFIFLPNSHPAKYVVTAKVENFSMPPIQIAGLPFSMDLSTIEKPDLSKNQEIKDLKEGTKKLADGAADLASGLQELKEASETLKSNLDKIVSGGSELIKGQADLENGLSQYTGGVDTLSANGKSIKDGLGDSAKGAGDLASGLEQSYKGINDYVNGVKNYVNGVDRLAANLPSVNQGAADLQAGMDQLASGVAQLGDGKSLLEGSAEIRQGLETMKKGLAALGTAEDMAKLKGQISALGTSAAELKTASEGFKTAIAEVETAVSGLSLAADGLYDGLGQMIASAEAQINAEIPAEDLIKGAGISPETLQDPEVQKLLTYLGGRQKNGLTQILNGLKALQSAGDETHPAPALSLKNGLAALNQSLPQLREGYESFNTGIEGLTESLPKLAGLADLIDLASGISALADNYAAFDEGLKSYIGGVNQLTAQVRKPAEGSELQNLYTGLKALSGGLNQLAGAGSQIEQGSEQLTGANADALTGGMKSLRDGGKTLADGLGSLKNGFGEYYGGVTALAGNSAGLNQGLKDYLNGVNELLSGLDQWAEGYGEFKNGLADAEGGSSELSDGTADLHRGTQTMDENMLELMDELLEDYEQLDGPQQSFASEQNGEVAHVQFVIMTEAIEIPKPAPEPVPEPEELSFWDRVVNLFR